MYTLKHPLFGLLKKEHLNIKEQCYQYQNNDESRKLLSEMLRKHHQKEEQLLFYPLSTHPQISEGGPMCTYFFDSQIISPPLQTAQKITGSAPTIPDSLSYLWSQKSPLRIPSAEHISLQHIIQYCETNELNKNMSAFIDILLNNFKKEEECLFHVCIRLLKPEKLDEIYSDWMLTD
jgi:hypothetical protein